MKLDIGSGTRYDDGITFGVDPFFNANIQAYMHNIPLDDESVDEIFTSHALEHVGKNEVLPALREWYRLLKPDGKLIVRVPNLIWCCKHYLDTVIKRETEQQPIIGWDLDIIYGNQNGWRQHYGEYHKTGFTPNSIKWYVREAGFTITHFDILNTHSQETLSIEAKK